MFKLLHGLKHLRKKIVINLKILTMKVMNLLVKTSKQSKKQKKKQPQKKKNLQSPNLTFKITYQLRITKNKNVWLARWASLKNNQIF